MHMETDEKRKGNPIATCRFRWQTYTKVEDYPLESEWEQFKSIAIMVAARYLIRQFNKFKKDDMIVKVFNEMNYKAKPTIITLDDAYRLTNTPNPNN